MLATQVQPSTDSKDEEVKVFATKLQPSTGPKNKEVKPNKSLYCPLHRSKAHGIHECQELERMGQKSLRMRRARLIELGLCPKCLGRHSAVNCRVKVSCDHCSFPHATILHIHRDKSNQPSNATKVKSADT